MSRFFDLIQSRYGWTDEIVYNLLFSRFIQLTRLLSKIKQEDTKERLIIAAFIGFQMGAAGGDMTFGQYIKLMNLSEKSEVISTVDITAEEAIDKAKGILNMAKRGETI